MLPIRTCSATRFMLPAQRSSQSEYRSTCLVAVHCNLFFAGHLKRPSRVSSKPAETSLQKTDNQFLFIQFFFSLSEAATKRTKIAISCRILYVCMYYSMCVYSYVSCVCVGVCVRQMVSECKFPGLSGVLYGLPSPQITPNSVTCLAAVAVHVRLVRKCYILRQMPSLPRKHRYVTVAGYFNITATASA